MKAHCIRMRLMKSSSPHREPSWWMCAAAQNWNGSGGLPSVTVIEWATYPGMKPNPHFIAQLEQQVDKEALVIFFCRSGVRSHHAAVAAAKAGYNDCYNMLEGFEGEMDISKHRNTIGGWRVAGLPWEQSLSL